MKEITFSTKPMKLKDQILLARTGKGDMEAFAELIVRRSDPAVSIDVVLELETDEAASLMTGLVASLQSSIKLNAMISEALTHEPRGRA